GIVYYILKVFAYVLLVKWNVYDSIDGCVVAYMKYAAEVGFVVRCSCQKRMLNGDVKQKYLVCNRMGFPKGIHVDTLDLENSNKLKRKSNPHITGCKARAVFNLDFHTRKFVLNVFDTIHNHELEREEFKHLSNRERQLTYLEQAFIVKAASVNIGATRVHYLLTGIKGSYLLVYGTKHISDFSFDYLVENAELSRIFWADEVSKYNYREFGDVVSFDATFKTNKKCVTVAAGLLKNKTTKSYIWLLKAIIKSFWKAPSIVATDQDGAIRNAIKAEFVGSKHRLCMWHITQKLPAKKEIFVGLWHFQIDSKSLVEGSEVCIIKESPYVYEISKKKKKPQSVDKGKDKAEEDDTIDLLFQKKMDFIRRWFSCLFMSAFCESWHIMQVYFFVFKNANVEMIPQQYILRRCTKNLIPAALRNKRNRYGEKNVVVENFTNEVTLIVDHCVYLLSKDEPMLGVFVEKLKSLKKEVEADCPNHPSKNKTDNLEQLVRVLKPPAVDVNNPTVGSTKRRKKLRIKGGKEKAIEKNLKGRNSCLLCGGTDHNKRTCPRRFEVQDEVCQEKVVVQKEACQEEVVQEKVDLAEDEGE
nr:protein FAR1-related sequence 5 [Tanacetum cinerariifolium]